MKQEGRVNGSAFFVFYGKVQVWSSGASAVATDGYRLPCNDILVDLNKDFGEMAVTDCDVAVADGDVIAAATVGTDLDHLSEHHGIDLRVTGAEVYAVMIGRLSRERVTA